MLSGGKNKAVFLDRDGTINIDKHYIHRIEDFEFIPGAIEALRLLQEAGFLLIIITNQSGIGRGYYTESDYEALNSHMLSSLQESGVNITASYYCPHLPDAMIPKYRLNCDCRKPKLGLFERAIAEHAIDLEISWAIGDKLRDLSICGNSACRGILVNTSEEEGIREAVSRGEYKGITYAADLLSASRILLAR